MSHGVIDAADIHVASISNKTKWIFTNLHLADGECGWGEATAQGIESDVVVSFNSISRAIVGLSPQAAIGFLRQLPLPDLATAAALSALDQALWDIIGRREGISIAKKLGGNDGLSVPVYANINRRTLDRSPEGFAKSAADALSAGHEAIKIAPFDEVTPDGRARGEASQLAALGLARMRAVRDRIGADRTLMVDCHWRLDMKSAYAVIDAAAEVGLYWVECPLPETMENLREIRALRIFANKRGVKLAGCEHMIRAEGFRPFIDAGTYDVIMPDVKYAGGLEDFLEIAGEAAGAGVQVSPHNPTGPISHAMSLQLCSCLGSQTFLETQFDETPLFVELQEPALPAVEGGRVAVPTSAGAGTAVARPLLAKLSA